jgi:hypothetical protein
MATLVHLAELDYLRRTSRNVCALASSVPGVSRRMGRCCASRAPGARSGDRCPSHTLSPPAAGCCCCLTATADGILRNFPLHAQTCIYGPSRSPSRGTRGTAWLPSIQWCVAAPTFPSTINPEAITGRPGGPARTPRSMSQSCALLHADTASPRSSLPSIKIPVHLGNEDQRMLVCSPSRQEVLLWFTLLAVL